MSLRVITGPMSAGKTTELLKQYIRARTAGLKVVLVTFAGSAARFGLSDKTVATHDGAFIDGAHSCSRLADLRSLLDEKLQPSHIFIDEVQLFDDDAATYSECMYHVVTKARHVVVAGLISDFRMQGWPVVLRLLPKADKCVMLRAICPDCGKPASFTRKLNKNRAVDDTTVQVGGLDLYRACCRDHHPLRSSL